MKNRILNLLLLTLVLASLGLIYMEKNNQANKLQAETVTRTYNYGTTTQVNRGNNNQATDYINIQVNRPVALSYKTKEQVYEIRKSYVKQSPFASPNYEPSNEVFGQIESNKPWKNATQCLLKDGRTGIDGPSEESRFINNPTALVQLEGGWCHPCDALRAEDSSPTALLIPKSIRYSKSKKEVEVTYQELVGEGARFDFKGLNARDLGYKFVYMDLSKSTFRPQFSNSSNISNKIHEYKDFIHCGGSCRWQGGCNNASPYQPEIEFRYKSNGQKSQQNATVYLKLWKNRPTSPNQEADMYEKIIINYI